jgi:hypothetical protein
LLDAVQKGLSSTYFVFFVSHSVLKSKNYHYSLVTILQINFERRAIPAGKLDQGNDLILVHREGIIRYINPGTMVSRTTGYTPER